MKVGRIIAGAVLGALFMLFVALDLVLFGVLSLSGVMVTLLPLVGLVAGGVLGGLAGRRRAETEAVRAHAEHSA